jgi:hypothetical protein
MCNAGKSIKGLNRMDSETRLRATAMSMIVRDTPQGFWTDLRPRAQNIYADTFAEVKTDAQVHPDQKIDDLLQRRHFRMEKLLIDLAQAHGLSSSMSLIIQNDRHHAYVFKGDVAMTQSYVQRIGELPHPARFRERLASSMKLPRLDLGDEPDGAFIIRNLYGLIAHNPIGRRFREEEQRLGMIQFCLPAEDCKAWAAELTIAEIVAAYPAEPKRSEPRRSPTWKRSDDKDTGAGEDK